MKRLIAIGLFVNVVLLAVVIGLLTKERIEVVHAAGGGGAPAGNGDVNGDGQIDLSDAVYTLSWLFTGGPAPLPIECPPPAGKGLPATGETMCYDIVGNEISCDQADYPGQDGFYQLGCPVEGRFMDHGDGTVTDTCTGLMWQKDTADVGRNGSISDEDLLNWQDALKYCKSLNFARHNDWRLPNVRELQSIVDYRRWGPAIDPVFGAESEFYWSSSTYVGYPAYAFYVGFNEGQVVYDSGKFIRNFVRAVRSGP